MGLEIDGEEKRRPARMGELDLCADGRSAVFASGGLYRVAIPGGTPERLTTGESHDHAPRFLADGSILFLSDRPDSENRAAGTMRLWLVPVGGPPRLLSLAANAVLAHAPARAATGIVLRTRPDAGEHEHLLFAPSLAAVGRAVDLTPKARGEHDDAGFDLSPDGKLVIASERHPGGDGRDRDRLRLFDLRSGNSRPITSGPSYRAPRFSADGRMVVAVGYESAASGPAGRWLVMVPIAGTAEPTRITPDLDLWPEAPVFAADGSAVYFTAVEHGRPAVFRAEVGTGRLTRLATGEGFSDVMPAPGGTQVYALASRPGQPADVVELEGTRGARAMD